MCEMIAVAISTVGRGSPEPFGYRVPRVTEVSDGPEESGSFESPNKLAAAASPLTVLALRLHALTIAPDC